MTSGIPLRILKIGTCNSLSEQSQLQYRICADVDRQIYLRITGNSSTGRYAKEAFPLAHIQSILAGIDPATPFTSGCLLPAFVGVSRNMAGFAMAVLLAEGLIEVVSKEDRRFRCADGGAFFKAIEALIAKGTNLQDDTQAKANATLVKSAPRKSKKVTTPEATPAA